MKHLHVREFLEYRPLTSVYTYMYTLECGITTTSLASSNPNSCLQWKFCFAERSASADRCLKFVNKQAYFSFRKHARSRLANYFEMFDLRFNLRFYFQDCRQRAPHYTVDYTESRAVWNGPFQYITVDALWWFLIYVQQCHQNPVFVHILDKKYVCICRARHHAESAIGQRIWN